MSHSWQYSTDPSSWVAIAIAIELGVAWVATFCRVCVMGIQHFAKAEDISRRRVDFSDCCCTHTLNSSCCGYNL